MHYHYFPDLLCIDGVVSGSLAPVSLAISRKQRDPGLSKLIARI